MRKRIQKRIQEELAGDASIRAGLSEFRKHGIRGLKGFVQGGGIVSEGPPIPLDRERFATSIFVARTTHDAEPIRILSTAGRHSYGGWSIEDATRLAELLEFVCHRPLTGVTEDIGIFSDGEAGTYVVTTHHRNSDVVIRRRGGTLLRAAESVLDPNQYMPLTQPNARWLAESLRAALASGSPDS